MTDYGHNLLFGTHLEPPPEGARHVVELAELTEQVGLDLVSISDHPYWPDRLDAVALLSAIVARTTTVRVASNLVNLPLRSPPVLARTAATLDILSNGRFELGLASGAQQMWNEIVAEGGPRRNAGESIEALDEAVQLIRALWTPGPDVRFHGRYYHLDGAKAGPFPVHDVNIWLGAYQPRMMRLVGRVADGWLPSSPYLPPEGLAAANRIIDDAALGAGRSPDTIRRIYNIGGEFTPTGHGFLKGPPRIWAEQLADLALSQGMSVFILYLASTADVIRQFAAEVAPAVREMVASERTSTP